MTLIQVCILGGGFSGLYTALQLARLPWSKSQPPQITLIDKEERFLFTPFLYELLTGEFQRWEIAPPYQKLLGNKNIRFYQGTIQTVDLENRQVRLQTGEILTYNYLVLAVGRETALNRVPGAATHAYPFRTLADAERLMARLQVLEASPQQKIRVAVAGGGPSGVELAGKLADRLRQRGQILLIGRGKQILAGFTSFSQRVARRSLEARGVRLNLETSIDAVRADQITVVHAGKTATISVDLVLWTTGTQPQRWLLDLACQRNSHGKLLALPTLQLVDRPEVLALGDLVDARDAQGQQVPATAQAAFQQANCAARNLRAMMIGKPLLVFRYLHLGEMLTLGVKEAIVCSSAVNLQGAVARVSRKLVYILLRMPTLRHRFQVIMHWLKSLFTHAN